MGMPGIRARRRPPSDPAALLALLFRPVVEGLVAQDWEDAWDDFGMGALLGVRPSATLYCQSPPPVTEEVLGVAMASALPVLASLTSGQMATCRPVRRVKRPDAPDMASLGLRLRLTDRDPQ